jgi:hypothetical protein
MSAPRKVSTDFTVGQVVKCPDPKAFLSPLDKYLTDRTGVVLEVFPVNRPNANYCGPTNSVSVLWGKRNGRGKEKEMTMQARDVEPA